MRRENLTIDESAGAMAAIMSGEATPAQISALLVGLTMKGERPAEIAGLARTMRANAVQLSRTLRRRVRHVRHRRRPIGHVQYLVGRGAGGGRRRACGWRNTATDRSPASAGAPTCTRRSA